MIALPIKHVDGVIARFSKQIAAQKINASAAIKRRYKGKTKKQKAYLDAIIQYIDELIVGHPDELEKLKQQFSSIISPSQMEGQKEFKDSVISALHYKTLRTHFYPQYFQKVGIKACVYCNALLTVTTESKKASGKIEYTAKYQLDHYLSQGKYPCFCISLYNLYPACSSCNLSKLFNSIDFALYTKDVVSTSTFEFELDPAAKANYLLSRDPEALSFRFNNLVDRSDTLFNRLFDIEGIYNTQKDIIEDLIIKSEIYTQRYKDQLLNDFPRLFKNPGDLERMLIDSYPEPINMHKRPLAKFKADIAKKLGLI